MNGNPQTIAIRTSTRQGMPALLSGLCTLLLSACQMLPPANTGPAPVVPAARNSTATGPSESVGDSPRLRWRDPGSEAAEIESRPAPGTVTPAAAPVVSAAPIVPAQAEIVDMPGLTESPDPWSAAPCPVVAPGMASLPPEAYGPGWCLCADEFNPSPEEFVCNGGDRDVGVMVKKDWSVFGLNAGDTVAHYDTLDGHTRITASNEVCLYAPRFAAVRKVYGPVINEQHDRAVGVELPLAINESSDIGEPTTVMQQLQPGRKHVVKTAQQYRERSLGIGIEQEQRPALAQDQFLPFEDLLIIRRGEFDNAEKARLANRLQAAVAWVSDVPLQVLIDDKVTVQAIGVAPLQSIYMYELPPGKSRLRICKIASQEEAHSGDLVDFTIRFDNVGDQEIGNVTILDRLHDRLELVPDSQSCSRESNFKTEDEDGSPRVLRWEIIDPLKVGEGGIIRFRCRVR